MLLLVNTSDHLERKTKNNEIFFNVNNKPCNFLEPFGGFQPLYDTTFKHAKGLNERF
jgi:hypothetical protein